MLAAHVAVVSRVAFVALDAVVPYIVVVARFVLVTRAVFALDFAPAANSELVEHVVVEARAVVETSAVPVHCVLVVMLLLADVPHFVVLFVDESHPAVAPYPEIVDTWIRGCVIPSWFTALLDMLNFVQVGHSVHLVPVKY